MSGPSLLRCRWSASHILNRQVRPEDPEATPKRAGREVRLEMRTTIWETVPGTRRSGQNGVFLKSRTIPPPEDQRTD
jgi:hypothetical protein